MVQVIFVTSLLKSLAVTEIRRSVEAIGFSTLELPMLSALGTIVPPYFYTDTNYVN